MLKQSVLASIAVASVALCGFAYARTQTPGPNGTVVARGPQGQFGQGQPGQPGQGQFGQGFGVAQAGPIGGGAGGGGGVAIADDNDFLYVVQGNNVFKITKASMQVVGQTTLRSTRPQNFQGRPGANNGGQFGVGGQARPGGQFGGGGGQGAGNNQ